MSGLLGRIPMNARQLAIVRDYLGGIEAMDSTDILAMITMTRQNPDSGIDPIFLDDLIRDHYYADE